MDKTVFDFRRVDNKVLIVVGCYIWYSEEGTGRGISPTRPLLAVPNLTSTASVPIVVLLNNGPLLCGFNVLIKWFSQLF